MNSTTNSQTTADPAATPPSPARTTAGLASMLSKRNAARASRAAASAPRPNDATPADNGSEDEQAPTSRQQVGASERRRTDDANLPGRKARTEAQAPAAADSAEADGDEDGVDRNQVEAGGGSEGTQTDGANGEDGAGDATEGVEEPGAKRGDRAERRINKLVGTIKRLEAENNRLKSSQTAGHGQGQGQQPATGPAPGAGGPEVEQLNHQLERNDFVHRWLVKNPDGGELKMDGRTVQVSADEAREMMVELPKRITQLTTKREILLEQGRKEFEAAQKQAREEAQEAYPWLSDPESSEFQEALAILQGMPQEAVRAMNALPNSRFLLADLVNGRRARLAAAAARTAPRPPARPTPQPGTTANAAPRTSAGGQVLKEVKGRYASSGRMSDLAQVLSARRRAAREVAA